MYRIMEDWADIRQRVLVEGVSRRQILRETGRHWLTPSHPLWLRIKACISVTSSRMCIGLVR